MVWRLFLRSCMLSILLAAVLIAGPGSIWPGNGGAAAAHENQSGITSAIFRFSSEVLELFHANPFRSECVGTFIASHLAVTANHCLKEGVKSLTVLCEHEDGELRFGTAPVRERFQHPTHDVSLIEFASSLLCNTGSIAIASSINKNSIFFAVKLPHEEISREKNKRNILQHRLPETVRSDLTIHVIDRQLCLSRGDSGTPLFLRQNHQGGILTGLLIRGTDGCPAEQTFVRLDQIRDWLENHRNGETAN